MFAVPTRAAFEGARPHRERAPWRRRPSALAQTVELSIDITTMADTENEDDEPVVLDLVDHAMGANPDPPEAFARAKLLRPMRTRVLRA
jgi:hypothetical protein